MQNTTAKRVVIVGGGFGGVNLAQRLCGDRRFRVTLVDMNNYNFFPPLLYQVATGFLVPSDISYPFRKLFRGKNVHFRMGKVGRIDPVRHICYLEDGELDYDYLVFACGATTN